MHHKWLGICCAIALCVSGFAGTNMLITNGRIDLYGYWFPVPGQTNITHVSDGSITIQSDGIHAHTNNVYMDGLLYQGSTNDVPYLTSVEWVTNPSQPGLTQNNPLDKEASILLTPYVNAVYSHGPPVKVNAASSPAVAFSWVVDYEAPTNIVQVTESYQYTTVGIQVLVEQDTTNQYRLVATYSDQVTTNEYSDTLTFWVGGPPEVTSLTIAGDSSANESTTNAYTLTGILDGPLTNASLAAGAAWTDNSTNATISGGSLIVSDMNVTQEVITITATYGGTNDTFEVTLTGTVEEAPPLVYVSNLPDIIISEPTTNYPVSFAAYTIVASTNEALSSSPHIAEWTRQADAGDTIALTGEWLDVTAEVPPVVAPAGTYPDMTVSEPTTKYPLSFAAYAPPVTNADVNVSSPAISEWTRQADAGDTIALTGENL